MVTSTQRFLNYELGKKNLEATARVFSASVTIHWCIAIVTLILAETVGLWFLLNYIQYPLEREWAVILTYQFAILSTCINMIRAPYNAAIIAYEKMSFYAYISIIEAVLRLLIVYLLSFSNFDRLIFYSFLMFAVIGIVTLGYYAYCKSHFSTCRYTCHWDKDLYRRLMGFSGWSMFGGVANIGASQGLNILLNMFFGVTVNAAMGIANQVQSAVYSFVGNFQTAFNPQIIKSYASGDRDYFIDLIVRTSKYSYFLLFTISLPLYICCEEVLSLWLGNVPAYAVSFCRLMILFSLLDAMQGPLWVSVQATGKIRDYQILMSVMILSNLPLSYLFLKQGYSPEVVLTIRCLLNLLILFVRLWYLRLLYDFPVWRYGREVICRIVCVTIISYGMISCLSMDVLPIVKILEVIFFSVIGNLFLVYILGFDNKERQLIIKQIKKHI